MIRSLRTINHINLPPRPHRRTPITKLTPKPIRSTFSHRQFVQFSMETDRQTTVSDDFVHVEEKDLSSSQTINVEEDLNSGDVASGYNERSMETGEISNENSVERDLKSEDDVAGGENENENESLLRETTVVDNEVVLDRDEIMKNVVVLECESSAGDEGRCDVYLVGTAHVSTESCREVQAVISYLKPQVVFLELCSSRVGILSPQSLRVPTMSEMMDMWKKKNTNAFGILYSWFLAKVATKLEVFPGSEFRVAYEEAMKYGGKVVLGDRPVNITLRRTWGKMKLWHKVKFLYSMFFQAVFLPSPGDLVKMLKEMDDVDMLTLVVQEMSKQFPTLMETLLYERDLYMSSTLLSVAREHASVVAVVGKGHLQGIKKNWKQPVELQELLTIPTKKPGVTVKRVFTSLGVVVAGAAIVSGIYYGAKR